MSVCVRAVCICVHTICLQSFACLRVHMCFFVCMCVHVRACVCQAEWVTFASLPPAPVLLIAV